MKFGKVSTANTGSKLGDTDKSTLIPDGWHDCIIVGASDHSRKEKPNVGVKFAVLAPGKDHHFAGWWENFYLTEKALPRLARLAKVTGRADGDPDMGEWGIEPENLVGAVVRVETEGEEYNGEMRVRASFLGFENLSPEPGSLADAVDNARAILAKWGEKNADGNADEPAAKKHSMFDYGFEDVPF